MSKRVATDNKQKNPKDFWATPADPVRKLAAILPPVTMFDEPCAGDGAIIKTMAEYGHLCIAAHDVTPRADGIWVGDACGLDTDRLIITNPPYRWELLEPLLDHWVGNIECWLLLPWDMPCNVRFSPYAAFIDRILPIGRVSWMQNGQAGFENSGWFHFSVRCAGLILPRQ